VEAEIVVVKLVGGTDRNRGRDKWMEHGHIRRREYKWGSERGEGEIRPASTGT
jgi:hypothetical protein